MSYVRLAGKDFRSRLRWRISEWLCYVSSTTCIGTLSAVSAAATSVARLTYVVICSFDRIEWFAIGRRRSVTLDTAKLSHSLSLVEVGEWLPRAN